MLHSVAPPKLITIALLLCDLSLSGKLSGIQSPLSKNNRNGNSVLVSRASSTNNPANWGTVFHSVIWCLVIVCNQYIGSFTFCCGGNTILPPTASNPNISYTDKSKLSSDKANTLSLAFIPNLVFIAYSVFTTPLWLIVTPLGFPVEPDVNIT